MKTVCVMSGGGAKGDYQVGVLKKLKENNRSFDGYYGTSVGALNSIGMSYGGISELEKVWRNIKGKGDILSFNTLSFLWSSGVYSLSPLKKLISQFVSDKTYYMAPVTVCQVDLRSGKIEYVSNDKSSPEKFADAVCASCAIPGVMEHVNGYVDGGVREQAPLYKAIQDGADKIVVILCNPITPDPLPYEMPSGMLKSIKIAPRAMDIMEHETFVNDIVKCLDYNNREDKKKIELEIYAPSTPLHDTLDFDPKKISEAIELGYNASPLPITDNMLLAAQKLY